MLSLASFPLLVSATHVTDYATTLPLGTCLHLMQSHCMDCIQIIYDTLGLLLYIMFRCPSEYNVPKSLLLCF